MSTFSSSRNYNPTKSMLDRVSTKTSWALKTFSD